MGINVTTVHEADVFGENGSVPGVRYAEFTSTYKNPEVFIGATVRGTVNTVAADSYSHIFGWCMQGYTGDMASVGSYSRDGATTTDSNRAQFSDEWICPTGTGGQGLSGAATLLPGCVAISTDLANATYWPARQDLVGMALKGAVAWEQIIVTHTAQTVNTSVRPDIVFCITSALADKTISTDTRQTVGWYTRNDNKQYNVTFYDNDAQGSSDIQSAVSESLMTTLSGGSVLREFSVSATTDTSVTISLDQGSADAADDMYWLVIELDDPANVQSGHSTHPSANTIGAGSADFTMSSLSFQPTAFFALWQSNNGSLNSVGTSFLGANGYQFWSEDNGYAGCSFSSDDNQSTTNVNNLISNDGSLLNRDGGKDFKWGTPSYSSGTLTIPVTNPDAGTTTAQPIIPWMVFSGGSSEVYEGTTNIGAIYEGSTTITKVYAGSTQIFGGGGAADPHPVVKDSVPFQGNNHSGVSFSLTDLDFESGDTLIFMLFSDGAGGTYSLPSGWTTLYSPTNNANYPGVHIIYKTSDGTETSVAALGTTSSYYVACAISCEGGKSLSVNTAEAAAAVSDPNPPAATCSSGDDLIIFGAQEGEDSLIIPGEEDATLLNIFVGGVGNDGITASVYYIEAPGANHNPPTMIDHFPSNGTNGWRAGSITVT